MTKKQIWETDEEIAATITSELTNYRLGIPNLSIRANQNGDKCFYFRTRHAGPDGETKDQTVLLGIHPEMGLSQAKQEAMECRAKITKNKKQVKFEAIFKPTPSDKVSEKSAEISPKKITTSDQSERTIEEQAENTYKKMKHLY